MMPDMPPVPIKGNKLKGTPGDEAEFALPVEVVAPSEVKVKLRELEQEFVARKGRLIRRSGRPYSSRWRYELAGRPRTGGGDLWSNAFWELPEVPVEGAWEWLHGEDRQAKEVPTGEEFEAALEARDQSPTLART